MKLIYQTVPLFNLLIILYVLYNYGILAGSLGIWLFYQLYYFAMKKLYNFEPLTAGDLTFMWNTAEETYNLIAIVRFDKMNPLKMKEYLYENGIAKFPKLRSRLRFRNFAWWWESQPLEKCEQLIEILPEENIKITNDKLLIDYATSHLEKRFDLEKEIPFKILIVQNKNNSEEYQNLVLFKMDHALSDGLGFISFIMAMADNYSTKLFPPVMSKQIPRIKKFLIYLMIPFNIIYHIYYCLIILKDFKSPLKTTNKVIGVPRISISPTMNFASFAKVSKNLGITFNDLIASCMSAGIKKCFKEEFKFDGKQFILFSPVGLKTIPLDREKIEISNMTAGVACCVDLIDNPIKDSKRIVNNYGRYLRKIFLVYAQKWLTDAMLHYLPFYVTRDTFIKFYHTFDITFSNIPGPKENLTYGESKVLDLIPAFTSGFSHAFVGLVSYSSNFRMTVVFDKSMEIDPSLFLKYFEDEFKNVLEVADTKTN